jgi:hypothetical protein
MDHISFIVVAVIVAALAFDFTNGFHDTANAMATSIATKALRPKVAVLISAVLNIAGAFLSTEVARTISNGIVNDAQVTPSMIFAGHAGREPRHRRGVPVRTRRRRGHRRTGPTQSGHRTQRQRGHDGAGRSRGADGREHRAVTCRQRRTGPAHSCQPEEGWSG